MDVLQLIQALPPRITAGDAFATAVQTNQPATSVLFFVLTGTIAGTPTRMRVGGDGSAVTANNATTYLGIAIAGDGTAQVTLNSSDTAGWAPGRYTWKAFAVDATGNRTEVAEGQIWVDPDPNGTAVADTRSYSQRILDQIRQVLLGATLDDTQMYRIGTRELTRIPRTELLTLEAVFEARVIRERRRRGQKVPSRNVGIVFGGR